ncbi:oligosaccharide flippase family protein [Rhizobium sp. FKL33]|uniref:oligosaccharide flippase family protein n=1 Tax=Rhizobium sp. FKL33 TaxID=2562307 RepID=UPI0010C0F77B|nr:oligosaccharide flippase family protein [Rhizobium sp. FKL33]
MNLNLRSNAVWSALEVIISGLSMFVLYRYVAIELGVDKLGLWSLVLATTSLARFGDIGAAAGLGRFVAIALSRNDKPLALRYMDTALIVNAGLYCVFAVGLYVPLQYAILTAVDVGAAKDAIELLPYALTSFVCLNLFSVTVSGLVGAQRADYKSKVAIIANLMQLFFAVWLLSTHGLKGLAWAQIIQYALAMVAGRLLVVKLIGSSIADVVPRRFGVAALKELFQFGVKLQLANIISFLFEPLSKYVISLVGGLHILGLYEMSYRYILQFRHVVVAPVQNLVSAFAYLENADGQTVKPLYEKATATVFVSAATILGGAVLFSPMASFLLLNRIDYYFVFCSAVFGLGWFCNVVCTPAYLLGVSRGSITWNIVGHGVASFIGPSLAWCFGQLGLQHGIVVMIMLGLSIGSIMSAMMNLRNADLSLLPSRSGVYEIIDKSRIAVRNLIRSGVK